MGEIRQKKIRSLLRQKISEIILKNELRDPRITSFICVTDVTVSNDNQYAKVYISSYGGDVGCETIVKILNNAAGYIQGLLGKRIHLRYTPKLSFYEDNSIERGFRIIQKLKEISH
ncbi:MAG: 30S ribosome-binding factor RbfA [Spirochaetales bacterium]|nr:30S ribosome-binding factor RbfA [Spirochaetales bacterium]